MVDGNAYGFSEKRKDQVRETAGTVSEKAESVSETGAKRNLDPAASVRR